MRTISGLGPRMPRERSGWTATHRDGAIYDRQRSSDLMLSSTGVTLRYMDGTEEPESAPEVAPLDWSRLDPKITRALVKAMRMATTVENDGHNVRQDYRYPTQANIACKARDALGEAGIHCPMIGWRSGDPGVVHAEFLIVHEDGPVSPVFEAAMPLGRNPDPSKALAGALTILRKYVHAGLLGMGWRDPTEDPDADNPRDQKQGPAQQNPQQKQGPSQQNRQVNPVVAHRAHVLKQASGWGKWLIGRGLPKERLFHYATGCDGEMPKPPATSVLEAIRRAGVAQSKSGNQGLPASDHASLISFFEHNEIVPLWSHGKRTRAGDGVDEKWPVSR